MSPVRLAIAYGYLGDEFHGSQYQPAQVTAQGVLEEVIAELTWGEPPQEGRHSLRNASRCDAGVHVRMNVAALEIPTSLWEKITPTRMVDAMNDHLPNSIWVWGIEEASAEWNPRHPIRRTYRFRLEGCEYWNGVEVEQLEDWLSIFSGTNDYASFSRPEGVATTIRTIERISPWMEGEHLLGFEVSGPSFVWNQVRRIASAIEFLARGKTTREEVVSALKNPDDFVDLGLSEADWLILWQLDYDEFSFSFPEQGSDVLSRRDFTASFREQQHWCALAKSEMRAYIHRQGLVLRRANNS
ncbi:MAG: hypothetical protein QGH90_03180 [Candidatus Poseidoniaceae archaeon]|jgi:tRNA pseudouridine38-40 synthase|nr:hypothetical protein [Candidatus Poseidoniaceae archaeon]